MDGVSFRGKKEIPGFRMKTSPLSQHRPPNARSVEAKRPYFTSDVFVNTKLGGGGGTIENSRGLRLQDTTTDSTGRNPRPTGKSEGAVRQQRTYGHPAGGRLGPCRDADRKIMGETPTQERGRPPFDACGTIQR